MTEAGHDVADGDVGGRLAAMGFVDHLVGWRPLGGQVIEQPGETGSRLRIVVAKTQKQLDSKRLGQLGSAVAVEGRSSLAGAAAANSEETVGDLVGLSAKPPGPYDRLGHPAQVLDEDQAKGDGDGPELTDGEGFDLLVGSHEPAQRFGIEAAVEMGDVRPGDPVHPRVTGQVTALDLG